MSTPGPHTVVRRLVVILERGVPTWSPPWLFGWPFNMVTGMPYPGRDGIRLLHLARRLDLASNVWATAHQWNALGCAVRPGPAKLPLDAWGVRILEPVSAGCPAGTPRVSSLLFNAGLVDGMAAEHARVAQVTVRREPRAERLLAATGATVRSGGDRAYYAPTTDVIHCPDRCCFPSETAYYATLFHELVHWTCHPSRLARVDGSLRPNTPAHAFEELVAELGSSLLTGSVGLPPAMLESHAAYLAIWLRCLRWGPRDLGRVLPSAVAAANWVHEATRVSPGRGRFAG